MERAIANLKNANALSLDGICGLGTAELEGLVRPSGYFRQKAARLKGFCSFVKARHGSLEAMKRLGGPNLRAELLSVNGIGNETCDSIMLYALGKRIFVVDAYTKRIVSRLLGLRNEPSYDELQEAFHSALRKDIGLYKDMHAQLVELAKRHCTKSDPLCEGCPLLEMCTRGAGAATGRQPRISCPPCACSFSSPAPP